MQVPNEVMFVIMLYADFKTLRRIATTCKGVNTIYHSTYFSNTLCTLCNKEETYFYSLVYIMNKYWIGNIANYDFVHNNTYLDDYILPPRTYNLYDMDNYDDYDEYIYRDDVMTKEALELELDEIASNITNYYSSSY